ncbi:MAG: hypothetical protein IKS56_07070 [Lachnospiraceae bacterium]|nr:hypothetical protein [Lachnospiraceae bacterium]
MKRQVFNPYLPSFEYIPDGEPRVFDGRLYIYGSHDRFNGEAHSTGTRKNVRVKMNLKKFWERKLRDILMSRVKISRTD